MSSDARKSPMVVIVIGMAGSGKTTLMKALHAHFSRPSIIGDVPIRLPVPRPTRERDITDDEIIPTNPMEDVEEKQLSLEAPEALLTEAASSSDQASLSSSVVEQKPEDSYSAGVRRREKLKTYIVNLDPAVHSTPYPVNIDIRDTIQYKQVMKKYKLGPNGAIMTSLNLFATKFDQVLELLEKRSSELDIILIDTPGQIEAFNWSASGSIILDSLAVSFPTTVLYVVDTPRCKSPITFMSNMMYACSVLYKSKLPFIMAFNKIDVRSSDECFKWMQSYNAYADDLLSEGSYMATLSRSCALVMNEFYEEIRSVSVSAANQLGLIQLEACINEAREEYFNQYLVWLTEQRAAVTKRRELLVHESVKKFTADRQVDREKESRLEELRERVEKTRIKNGE